MSDKLQNLHLEAILNTKGGNYLKRYEEITLADKCSNITEDISIKFLKFCNQNRIKYQIYTDKELFNKFIETL